MTDIVVNSTAAPAPAAAPAGAPAPAAVSAPLNIGKEAPAPAPADNRDNDGGGEVIVEYNRTGDPGLDMALGFIGKFGIGPEHPGMVAAKNGDFGILKATFATMGDKAKGWEQYLDLGQASYQRTAETNKARAEKDRGAIEAAVGGAAAWAAIQSWAATNAEPHEREEVNAALAKGGLVAKAMANHLANLFERSAGTRPPTAKAYSDNAAAATSKGNAFALSPREYTAEVEKLYSKMGGRMTESAEYRSLQARRQSWRG